MAQIDCNNCPGFLNCKAIKDSEKEYKKLIKELTKENKKETFEKIKEIIEIDCKKLGLIRAKKK